jgi:hypothetical protein
MPNEAERQRSLLSQVLKHIDTVLAYPERRSSYQGDKERAHFTPSLEFQASDNLRVSVGLARHYAGQQLRDGVTGLQSLRLLFEGSGFTIREQDEQVAIVGQHFELGFEPAVQTYEDSR